MEIKCTACSNVVSASAGYIYCPYCCYPLNPTGPEIVVGSSFERNIPLSSRKIPVTQFSPSDVTHYRDFVIEVQQGSPPPSTHPYICLGCLKQVSDILDAPCSICGQRLWRMRRKK